MMDDEQLVYITVTERDDLSKVSVCLDSIFAVAEVPDPARAGAMLGSRIYATEGIRFEVVETRTVVMEFISAAVDLARGAY